jgi:hypothetical protein
MKIYNCAQETDEWFKLRIGMATASQFKRLVTLKTGVVSETSIKTYAFELASELLTGKKKEVPTTFQMQQGIDLEPYARQAYEDLYMTKVVAIGFALCAEEGYGCSPDGLVGDEGLVEIKCTGQVPHLKCLYEGVMPCEYKAQVQGQMLVMDRRWCDFVSYNPDYKEDHQLFVVRVERDDAFIEKLKEGLRLVIEQRNALWLKLI